MYSIGDIIDKLVIENIKIAFMREQIHSDDISDEEHVKLFNNMNILNQNRAALVNMLDDKINKVANKEEINNILKIIKTY